MSPFRLFELDRVVRLLLSVAAGRVNLSTLARLDCRHASRAPAPSRPNRPSASATPIRAAAAASQTLEALGLFSLCAATKERESREGEEKKKQRKNGGPRRREEEGGRCAATAGPEPAAAAGLDVASVPRWRSRCSGTPPEPATPWPCPRRRTPPDLTPSATKPARSTCCRNSAPPLGTRRTTPMPSCPRDTTGSSRSTPPPELVTTPPPPIDDIDVPAQPAQHQPDTAPPRLCLTLFSFDLCRS
ncbi:translation initiation factor IF-2-like [Panicum virgatum]|uniref:translation initiation factor IF-2-like n=1 Tax=Panicum virgatum TaxID=38727 RepID=UPI0019D5010F|nr:translation initiation factor IF-2-like [Panicum virgatum]